MSKPHNNNPFIGDVLAIQAIWKVLFPAVGDDHELATFLTNRAYVRGIPLNDLKGKNRDALITCVLNVSPSKDGRDDLVAIAQTVAILGEGMKISRELATAAKNATGL